MLDNLVKLKTSKSLKLSLVLLDNSGNSTATCSIEKYVLHIVKVTENLIYKLFIDQLLF